MTNDDIANALESSDWSGVSIGNKSLIKAAIAALGELKAEIERKDKAIGMAVCYDLKEPLLGILVRAWGSPRVEPVSEPNTA